MKKKIIKWILVVIWMGVIFYFSNFNSVKSTNQSRSIVSKTNIVEIYEEKNSVTNDTALENVDRLFRKVAHVIEFFILAILVCNLASEYNSSLSKTIFISFVVCFIYSISDEVHQLLIPGRSGEIRDIIKDNIGVSLGLLLFYIFKRRKI